MDDELTKSERDELIELRVASNHRPALLREIMAGVAAFNPKLSRDECYLEAKEIVKHVTHASVVRR